MPIPTESIEVGKCYLADRRETPQVWQVVAIFPDGRLEYKSRSANPKVQQRWLSKMTTSPLFASMVSRTVPCDWFPGTEGDVAMPVPPEPIEVAKCYLSDGNTVRRVVMIHPDGRIQYEWRAGNRKRWKVGILSRREFAAAAEREVPCDWTPEGDG